MDLSACQNFVYLTKKEEKKNKKNDKPVVPFCSGTSTDIGTVFCGKIVVLNSSAAT